MSYANSTRSKRGGGAAASSGSGGRPALHTRQHSANTAGDVFAMFGAPSNAAGSAGSQGHTGGVGSAGAAAATLKQKSGSATAAIDGHGTATSHAANGASSPSSSGPSTPTSASNEKSRRFSSLYSPPVLLKLWHSGLTAKILLEDLYSAFEVSVGQVL